MFEGNNNGHIGDYNAEEELKSTLEELLLLGTPLGLIHAFGSRSALICIMERILDNIYLPGWW